MKKLVLAIASILGASLLSTQANSASFDCKKAATWVEKTICKSPELSKLDDAMAKKYKQNLTNTFDYEDSEILKGNMIIDQRLWLKFQRNTCKETECLIREYKEYIEDKNYYGVAWNFPDELSRSDLPSKNEFGKFSQTFKTSIYNSETNRNDPQEVTNTLSIYSVANKPYLSIIEGTLFFTNFHTCDVGDNIATWSQNHWVINDDGQDEILELRLYPAPYKGKTQLLLKDIDDQFRSGRCGVRGYFDGIVLERE
ncbi:uncharacterized protein YecT (DUF1311 family) [Psychrobacter sp. PL15]|uniref:lysozyme inhibitor LprI family protein n=1 Tax=Psychrobacter sp. PL15 TaxID=3071719 RepID=UPI002E0C68A1|nr:uncharacterized protein YecT (DUF1311 family) [Psychrobacter sp. PL15]